MHRKRFKIFGHSFWRESAGVISSASSWCCKYECYLHVCPTLWGLVWEVFTEHRNERHLVG